MLYLHRVWQLTAKLRPMSFIPRFTGISVAAISSYILVSFLVQTLVHIRSNGRAFSLIGRCLRAKHNQLKHVSLNERYVTTLLYK